MDSNSRSQIFRANGGSVMLRTARGISLYCPGCKKVVTVSKRDFKTSIVKATKDVDGNVVTGTSTTWVKCTICAKAINSHCETIYKEFEVIQVKL